LVVGGTQSVLEQWRMLQTTSAPIVIATPDRLIKILQEGPLLQVWGGFDLLLKIIGLFCKRAL